MVMQSGAAVRAPSKERRTFERRLCVHRWINPLIAWGYRNGLLFAVGMASTALLLIFIAFYPQSLWPIIPFFAYMTFIVFFVLCHQAWWVNITRIVAFNDVAAVAPLLDFANVHLFAPDRKPLKPLSLHEMMALPHLPDLLARMPAGDGPALTSRQRSALRWLVFNSQYGAYFIKPGLLAKIETITQP